MHRYALTASFLVILVAAATPARAQGTGEVEFDCLNLSGNLDTNENICTEFHFNDGTTDIRAGIAISQELDFANNEWTFENGLSIAFRDAEVSAEQGQIVFSNDEAIQFELTGSPAQMTVLIAERDLRVSGTAESISYQAADETLRMLGEVVFVIGDDNDRITACDLIYNLSDNTYSAGNLECGGVRAESSIPGSDSGGMAVLDSQ